MAAEILATLPSSNALVDASEATEFGAAIRDMRLAHNADLATVAATLRIRLVYLQAIEDGRFDELPGPTYAAGFVRAYAEFLGLDLSEVMRRYREVALGSDRQAPLVAPSPVVEGTMPTGFILLVAAVLAAIAYGSWNYLTANGRDMGDIVANIPQQIAEMVGMKAGAPETSAAPQKPDDTPAQTSEQARNTADQSSPGAAVEPASLVEAPETPEPVANSPAPAQLKSAAVADKPVKIKTDRQAKPAPVTETARRSAAAANDVIAAVQEPAARPAGAAIADEGPPARLNSVETTALPAPAPAAPDPAAPPKVPQAVQTAALPGPSADEFAGPAPPSRVTLRATAISWVELRDANGKRVFSRLLKKGETYNVPGRGGITLATGNAGALDVLVDGRTIGPLGPVGAVRRNVLLEPAALLQRVNAR